MSAVNQINAQIKITELWKAINDEDHPFKIIKVNDVVTRPTRACSKRQIKLPMLSKLTKRTFINDGIKAWNLTPLEIKNSFSF